MMGFRIKRKTAGIKESKRCAINELYNDQLKMILQFLNIVEITLIMRVCSRWKRMIEKERDLLVAIDLTTLPKKTSNLNFIKIITKSTQLKRLGLPENVSNTDTLS